MLLQNTIHAIIYVIDKRPAKYHEFASGQNAGTQAKLMAQQKWSENTVVKTSNF